MKKIFYAPTTRFASTNEAIQYVFEKEYNLKNVVITRNENGKPYLEQDSSHFFSITHTKDFLFIALSDQNVGIDAELTTRKLDYVPILKKFTTCEREQIQTTMDFLKFWTIKESIIKWLGGSLALDLQKVSFVNNQAYYKALPLPVQILLTSFQNHVISICSESDFNEVEFFSIV